MLIVVMIARRLWTGLFSDTGEETVRVFEGKKKKTWEPIRKQPGWAPPLVIMRIV